MKSNGKSKKDKLNILVLVVSLIVGVFIFFGLIMLQNSMIEKTEYESVVVFKSSIKDDINNQNNKTYLSESQADSYFEVVQYVKGTVPDKAIRSMEELKSYLPGYISNSMCSREPITTNMLTKVGDISSTYQDKMEVGVKVSSFDQAAGGLIRSGNYIRIDGYDKEGNLKYTLDMAYVSHAFASDGTEVNASTSSAGENLSAVAFNIWLEKSELEEFNNATESYSMRITLLDSNKKYN